MIIGDQPDPGVVICGLTAVSIPHSFDLYQVSVELSTSFWELFQYIRLNWMISFQFCQTYANCTGRKLFVYFLALKDTCFE